MHWNLEKVAIVLFALAVLGILIANLVVGLNIETSSSRAADSSEIAAQEAVKLNQRLDNISNDIKIIIEWILKNFPPTPPS
jgi:hypothetical protein